MADARVRRHLSPNVAAGGLLLVLAVALLLWQRPWQSSASNDVVPIPDDAASILGEQFRALSEAETRAAFAAAAGSTDAARSFASDAWAARSVLDVTDIEIRYLQGGEAADRADGSTVAQVAVSWEVGPDSVISGTTVRDATVNVRLDPAADGTFAIRSAAGAAEDPVPVWLAGCIRVERADGVEIVTVDGGTAELDVGAVAQIARDDVRDVVPGVDDGLTIISPATGSITADLVGRSRRAVAPIAAITTTVDGGTETARVVVLNPEQFEVMDARAAQVVVTHEATHQLTGAIGTDAENWVAEGFADFVALRGDSAPLTLSAGQILRQADEDGPPAALPTAADFARGDHGLGAVYESAWMVFRMLAERFDDQTIVGFYRDVLGGTDTDVAVGDAFDLSLEQLTTQWRDYLTKSASTVS